MNKKQIICQSCSKEIAAKAKVCPYCGAKNVKPFFKKWFVWILLFFILIGIIGNIGNSADNIAEPSTSNPQNNTVNTDKKNLAFAGDCGISAIAEMGTDIIGQPIVTVSITNTTNKDINAIQFYAIPLDVYGEEIKDIFTQNNLYTDDTIPAGKSDACTFQFIDNHVKTIQLYAYSVYFSDGTEWGDKEATKSVILNNALQIEVNGTSEK